MILRSMQQEDFAEVAKLESEIFSEPWSEESFKKAATCPENLYLIVRIDNKLCAYCGFWGIAGEGQITNVAVHPDYRRHGIARKMLEELLRQGIERGLNAFTLEVRVGNLGALRLYHSLGFQDAGIRRQFYSHPKEDAMILWLIKDKETDNTSHWKY